MTVTGFTAGPDANTNASFTNVGPRYFSTLGIPPLAGREFTDADTEATRPVAVVNEAFVRKFRLGANAVGARLGTTEGQPPDIEIVGVVADAAYRNARDTPPPQYFRPYRQTAAATLSFYVRTAPGVDPSALMGAIPGIVHRFDPNLPVDDRRTMDEQFDENTTSERIAMMLVSAFAALAALLAGIGLYAVLAYSVSQRVREIGIRMALGARGGDVRPMVLAQSSRITFVATVVGVARGWPRPPGGSDAVRRHRARRSGAGWRRGLMLAVALLAGVLPARRAAAVDPVEALRAERRRATMFETLRQDVRHGWRMLMRHPGFALVAILSIAVGVAACATIFSVADGFVIRPLPVPRAGEILTISATTPADRGNGLPSPTPTSGPARRRGQFQRRFGAPLLITSFAASARTRRSAASASRSARTSSTSWKFGHTSAGSSSPKRIGCRAATRSSVISYETWTQLFGSDPGSSAGACASAASRTP